MKLKDLTEHLLTESKATYYHGSDYEFDSFNIANAGKTGLAYGIGIYLTSDKEDAMRYGKKCLYCGDTINAKSDSSREKRNSINDLLLTLLLMHPN